MANSSDHRHGLRDESFRPAIDAYAFFAFVVFGAGYIIVAKNLNAPQGQVTTIPVVLMLAYAGMMIFVRGLRIRSDHAGDNLYYMGFLFTLVSLGMALFRFSSEGGADEIVRNFGIAIASTIVGVALRVAFNQIRRDPLEVERTSRLELADASRRVRRELDATVAELNFFRRAAQQSLAESFTDVRNAVDTTTSGLTESLQTLTSKAQEPLNAASLASTKRLEDLTASMIAALATTATTLSEENARLAKSAKSITEALTSVSSKLSAMKTPDQVIELKVEPVVAMMKDALDQMQSESREQIDTLKATAQQFMDVLAKNHQASEARAAANEDAKTMLVRVTAAMSHAADKFTSVSQQLSTPAASPVPKVHAE